MLQEDWQRLPQGEPLKEPAELKIPRAAAIARAVARHPDCELIRCSRLRGARLFEILVVDVECNGVPPANSVGIEFRERLALLVDEDDRNLVEVVALRQGFPRLMHQNAGPPGFPPSLCLYFEPPRTVTRTWTAASFLRRIQFWLEKSSRNELHAADQPVEQVFFSAPNELVVPWNVDSLLERVPQVQFDLVERARPKGMGSTFFLREQQPDGDQTRKLALINVKLPVVAQGRIEQDPVTLGDLVTILSDRGADLIGPLKAAIEGKVGPEGVPVASDTAGSIILLHMPIARGAGAAPERIVRRGYLVHRGAFSLGQVIGELFTHEGRFWREAKLTDGPPISLGELGSIGITPIEVLRNLDRATARAQSGSTDPGPTGTVVGVGALGGSMLDFWVRAGWGKWTAIDKDHIKPHNLVRHPADQRHVGLQKEDAAFHRANQIVPGADSVSSFHADACELVEGRLAEPLRKADLVVDASTTLEYPRLSSEHDDASRHVSVFLTPSGSGSVLLLEDAKREIRLRTLEAQYYRAVIQQPWGADHLAGSLGTFWSGAGCRDISVVMPYTAVMAHSSNLAAQVQRLSLESEPAIRIWTRNVDGSVQGHNCDVHGERRLKVGDTNLFLDHAVIEKMRQLRSANLPNETGGILLGYHDQNIKATVIVEVMPAPADSQSSPAHFKRGVQGVLEAVQEAMRRTAGVVGYIGEWHSHPPGHGADPSPDDLYQLAYLALGMSHEGLPAVSIIVGADGDLQAMNCEVRE